MGSLYCDWRMIGRQFSMYLFVAWITDENNIKRTAVVWMVRVQPSYFSTARAFTWNATATG
jgi:hypothetical protein